MKELTWANELDGAFCFGNSFAYFDEEGNRQFLEAVYRALKEGGRFMLQTNVIAESILTRPLSRTWYEMETSCFCIRRGMKRRPRVLISDYQFIRDQEVEKKTAVYRIYTVKAVFDLLQSVGFREPKALGSLNGDPFKWGILLFTLLFTNKESVRRSFSEAPSLNTKTMIRSFF